VENIFTDYMTISFQKHHRVCAHLKIQPTRNSAQKLIDIHFMSHLMYPPLLWWPNDT